MERTVAWLGVALPEQSYFCSNPVLFFAHARWSCMLRWRPVIPAVHDTLHNFRHAAGRGSLSLKNFIAFFVLLAFLFSGRPSWAEISISISKRRRDWSCCIPILIPQPSLFLLPALTVSRWRRAGWRFGSKRPPRLVFSNGFPFGRGQPLLDMSLPLRQGRAEWKYLFPIRGQYRLT